LARSPGHRVVWKEFFRLFPAIMLLMCGSLLAAVEPPSKPFLEKNSFYLSSAGSKSARAAAADPRPIRR
jgi:hypothetical protein